MMPSDDATSSQRKKRRAESSEEDLSARESSRLRIDYPAEEPEEAKNRTFDDTDESSDLVAPHVFASRPLSPDSLWRFWAQQSVARGGKRVRFVENEVSVSSRRLSSVTDRVADDFPVCFNSVQ